ncbi:hypothetical protein MTR67_027327 [Solanum verrucosum]|uniref:Uncharacterized protein n=1 Tax=Solanum verrucosum TaxID=315347 RepID=A0AAF0R0I6_SOLVR|nr:hypothetical protein MTR67_027327 [Solanum verrucosum]
MLNYGHKPLNSRTFEYNFKRIRNSILKNLELDDTTPLKEVELMEFMRNYRHERLDSRVYILICNSCTRLLPFSYLLPQNLAQIDS